MRSRSGLRRVGVPILAVLVVWGCGDGGDDQTDPPPEPLAWAVRAGGASLDGGAGVAVQSDGSVLVTGLFCDTATFGPGEPNETTLISAGDADIFLARFNP